MCVITASRPPQAAGARFTQPKDHSLAGSCTNNKYISLQNAEWSTFKLQTTSLRCSTWLRSDAEYQLERDVFHLYPERHKHTKLMLFHNVERPQTYK